MATRSRARPRRLRYHVAMTLGFLALLVLPGSRLDLRGVDAIAANYRYPIVEWEIQHFTSKWFYKLWDLRPGAHRAEDTRKATILRYFELADEAARLEDRVRQAAARSDLTGSRAIEADLDRVRRERDDVSLAAQEAIEGLVASIMEGQDLGSRFGLVLPPVDFTFDDPPRVLITSPRDKMQVQKSVLLRSDVSTVDMEAIEARTFDELGLSALVEGAGGLATYPAVISPDFGLTWTLQTVAHEWTHQFLFFHPLGRGYFKDQDMVSLNEMVADIVGAEIGAIAYERIMGRPLPVPASASPVTSDGPPRFDFTKEMRATRVEAEKLLAEGKIEEAEAYMEQRRQAFVQQGYAIRKLNQAYFAFHGSYADSAATTSPVLGQLRELRRLSPSLVAFLNTVSGADSYTRFVHILGDARGSTDAAVTP